MTASHYPSAPTSATLRPAPARDLGTVVPIRLPRDTLAQLQEHARSLQTDPSALVAQWVTQRLGTEAAARRPGEQH